MRGNWLKFDEKSESIYKLSKWMYTKKGLAKSPEGGGVDEGIGQNKEEVRHKKVENDEAEAALN
jgi:hypothetical protein